MDFKIDGKSVTYGEAYDMLEKLKNRVFGTEECRYRCKFVHSGDMKDGHGDEVFLDPMEGDVRVVAADGGCCKSSHVVVCVPDEFFDESLKDCPVDAYKFIGMAVAIFHERRHVEQHLIARKGGSAFADVMYLAHMTNLGNPEYDMYNYYTDPVEVDAQHMALRNLYQYLSGLVGSDAANEYVCFYQEMRHAVVEEAKAEGKKLIAEGKITAEYYKSNAYIQSIPLEAGVLQASAPMTLLWRSQRMAS